MIALTTQTDSTTHRRPNTSKGSSGYRTGKRISKYRKKLIRRLVMFVWSSGLVAVCVLSVGLITRQTEGARQGPGTNVVLVSSVPSEPIPIPVPAVSPAATTVKRYTEEEVRLVAQMLYGEARGCNKDELRLVVWCVCNRVDKGTWGNTVEDVIKYPYQFMGYGATHPVWPELEAVAREVLEEWNDGGEADILEPYAKTSKYLFFRGDGKHNWYKEEW